jgi:uncharacterized protein YebE (UPF0316 family)
MDPSVAITCLLIFVARIADVSLGTLRTVWLVQGRRTAVFFIGFVEVLIWVVAVSKVVTNLHEPIYAVIYSIGSHPGTTSGSRSSSGWPTASGPSGSSARKVTASRRRCATRGTA